MAQVVLTDTNKEALLADPNFLMEVKWALSNRGSTWRGDNGVGKADAASAARWAKSRDYATEINNNPAILNNYLNMTVNATQMITFIVRGGIAVWDNVANTTAACIAWMLANGTFTSFADDWFDNVIATRAF